MVYYIYKHEFIHESRYLKKHPRITNIIWKFNIYGKKKIATI